MDLLKDASSFRDKIAKGKEDINEARVAALVPNGCEFEDSLSCSIYGEIDICSLFHCGLA